MIEKPIASGNGPMLFMLWEWIAREIEIAAYLLDRLDYSTMAARLLVSHNMVKTHVKRIYDNLDISRRKQLEIRIAELLSDSSNQDVIPE